jgi:hypothetical protein
MTHIHFKLMVICWSIRYSNFTKRQQFNCTNKSVICQYYSELSCTVQTHKGLIVCATSTCIVLCCQQRPSKRKSLFKQAQQNSWKDKEPRDTAASVVRHRSITDNDSRVYSECTPLLCVIRFMVLQIWQQCETGGPELLIPNIFTCM